MTATTLPLSTPHGKIAYEVLGRRLELDRRVRLGEGLRQRGIDQQMLARLGRLTCQVWTNGNRSIDRHRVDGIRMVRQ